MTLTPLGTYLPRLSQKSSLAQPLFWGTLIVSLFTPVIFSWVIFNFFNNDDIYVCDKILWDTHGKMTFNSPFVFYVFNIQHNIILLVVIIFSILVTLYFIIKKFYLIRFKDFPYIIFLSFFIFSVLTFLVFINSLSLYADEVIQSQLGDPAYRTSLFDRNREVFKIAVEQQANHFFETQSEFNKFVRTSIFSNENLYSHFSDGPISLFDSSFGLYLFDTCQEEVGMRIFKDDPKTGFSSPIDINVRLTIPIQFEITEGSSKFFSRDVVSYYVMVLQDDGFSSYWALYYIVTLIPFWLFFLRFSLYKYHLIKIRR